MGNRAVITASTADNVQEAQDIGVYLHWDGGRATVEALLAYCEAKGYRKPDKDNYGWARLCQVAGNMIGDTLSLGVDRCDHLDCDNRDNGTYIIGGYSGWSIIDRKYFNGVEQGASDSVSALYEMMQYINERQPKAERLDNAVLATYAVKHYNEWHDTAIEWKPAQEDKPAEETPQEDGWISVSDRLPERDGFYFVFYGASEYPRSSEVSFSDRWQCWNCFNSFDDANAAECLAHACNLNVTHWMPLPAAPVNYKKEEK